MRMLAEYLNCIGVQVRANREPRWINPGKISLPRPLGGSFRIMEGGTRGVHQRGAQTF